MIPDLRTLLLIQEHIFRVDKDADGRISEDEVREVQIRTISFHLPKKWSI